MCKILNDSQWQCLSQPVSEHIVCCSTAVMYIAWTQTEGHDKQSLLHLFGVIVGVIVFLYCSTFCTFRQERLRQPVAVFVTTCYSWCYYCECFTNVRLWYFLKWPCSADRMLKSNFWLPYGCVSVVYIFDAQTGKAMGDGKPVTHKVSALCSVLEWLSFLTFS